MIKSVLHRTRAEFRAEICKWMSLSETSRSLSLGVLLKDLSNLPSDRWKELISHPDFLQVDLIVGMNQNVAHSCHGTPGYLCVLDSNLPAQSLGGFSK